MNGLGYDPRPDEDYWHGTAIPPVRLPLAASPERESVCEEVWWRGPPWTILRNGPQFVRQVMDFGGDEVIGRMQADVPHRIWRLALTEARPGDLSRGAKTLWSLLFGLMQPGELPGGWLDDAHIRDFRPLAGRTGEHLRRRLARCYGTPHGGVGAMANGIRGCLSRGAAADYRELLAMLRNRPDDAGGALTAVVAHGHRAASACAALAAPPVGVSAGMSGRDLEFLAATAVRLARLSLDPGVPGGLEVTT